MKIIVVGGGASGIVASIFSKNNDNEVIVLEKNSKPLKKLLLTGNGKCNYFNDDFSFEHYCSSDIDFVKNVINDDNKKRVLDFFLSIGVVPRIRNGYYYPNSNQAYSVYNSLLKEASLHGVEIKYDTTVLNIVKNDKFIVNTNNGDYECDKVIISTGGKSYSKTGSSGDGYLFGSSFGHRVNDIYPGLVQLVSSDKFLKDLSGVRSDVCVSLLCNGNVIKSEVGEIQFTDYGISGICVFNLSNYVGKLINKGVSVKINFFNSFNINDVPSMIDFLDSYNKKVCNRTITELLEGFLNYKIVNVILKLCSIDSNCSWDSLSDFEKKNLCNHLVSFNINIIDTKGYDNAQVSVGGISLDDINNNFESKIVSGLYFTGEVLDVTGDCGGYNLGFAFLSGMVAGSDIGGKND